VLRVSLIGTLLVVAYALLGIYQILVLNPLAAVPGTPIEQIRAEVAASQGVDDRFLVVGFLSLGPLLAVALLIVAVARLPHAPWLVAGGYLELLVLGAPAYFVARFSSGMNLADTHAIGGTDYSPWGGALYATSAVALGALIALLVAHGRRRGSRPAPDVSHLQDSGPHNLRK
jgi:hypothetical protein